MVSATKAMLNHYIKWGEDKVQDVYDRARFLEPIITEDLSKVINELETSLTGTEFSVKSGSSIRDKLERKEKKQGALFEPVKGIREMVDLVRYTEICEHKKIYEVTNKTIEELNKKGYVLTVINNYFATPYPGTGYMGMHLNFISPQGQKMELQVHSGESFEVKQKGHELYERMRAVGTPVEEKEKLKPEILAVHSSIEKPTNIEKIENYQMDVDKIEKIVQERQMHCKMEIEKVKDSKNVSENYKIYQDSKMISYGFENKHSDESVYRYTNINGEGEAISITNTGLLGFSERTNIPALSINDSFALCKQMEREHEEWAKDNDIEKDRDVAVSIPVDEIKLEEPEFALHTEEKQAKEVKDIKIIDNDKVSNIVAEAKALVENKINIQSKAIEDKEKIKDVEYLNI